jgi:predicted PurR-regulated permease PerM
MEGILALIVVALLGSFCVRWAASRMRLPIPARASVLIVFVLVVLALWGQSLE